MQKVVRREEKPLFSLIYSEKTSRWHRDFLNVFWASQVAQVVKNSSVDAGDSKRRGFDPWVGKISWSRKGQPTPVFLPGKSHGQRSQTGHNHGVAKGWTQLHEYEDHREFSGYRTKENTFERTECAKEWKQE